MKTEEEIIRDGYDDEDILLLEDYKKKIEKEYFEEMKELKRMMIIAIEKDKEHSIVLIAKNIYLLNSVYRKFKVATCKDFVQQPVYRSVLPFPKKCFKMLNKEKNSIRKFIEHSTTLFPYDSGCDMKDIMFCILEEAIFDEANKY